MNVMSAKQTMIFSFYVSMLAPWEKHSWCFCFFSSLPCTCRKSGLTHSSSVYWWETECNKEQALSKYLEFSKSCFNFYKAWSQSVLQTAPVCTLAITRRLSGAGSPWCTPANTRAGSHQLCLAPSTTSLWHKGISSTKRAKRVNWQHALVPRKYEQELEKAQEWRFTFKHIWKTCNHLGPEVRQTRQILGTTVLGFPE